MTHLMRVQVLLDAAQRRALSRIAKREGRSVSDVLREMVDRGLSQRIEQQAAWRQALARLNALRESNSQSGIYPGYLVAEGRAARDDQLERLWPPSS